MNTPKKLATPEQAAMQVKSKDTLAWGHVNGKPIDFDKALANRKDELEEIIIFAGCTLPPLPEILAKDPKSETFIYHNVYFSPVDRMFNTQGTQYYLPMNYSDGAHSFGLICSPDITVVQVAPMDDNGFFNYGPQPSYSDIIVKAARQVIVEVNNTMPRVMGATGSCVHISDVDFIIEGTNTPLFGAPAPTTFTEEDKKIASYVVNAMHDGVCLQLGIGELPTLIGQIISNSDLKDLGVHSEMFVEPYIDIFESGKATGKYKTTDPGKMAYTFTIGSPDCYAWLHDNPAAIAYSSDYICSPEIIALNDNMFSVNSCVEIDLFTQVCSESTGYRQISGSGGQLDFIVGTFRSKGGKSLICTPSTFTTKKGELKSRIVPTVSPGGTVTTPRTYVDYVVTENGMVQMRSKSTWQRAEALISIAHPEFHDSLIREADKMGIWRKSNKSDAK
ncbi:MAG TPA: acetyl-CoA hydrolase/transferase C-terminal domain-containing protein [Syntrophomonadaceae bacterium]|nr:acetyl-CoA hydrolase/transferase C-terminal domain-containing protein [Syntrophomonadaceae bacterium]